MAALPPLPVADAIAAAAADAIAAFALLRQHGVACCQRTGLSICCSFAAVGQMKKGEDEEAAHK